MSACAAAIAAEIARGILNAVELYKSAMIGG